VSLVLEALKKLDREKGRDERGFVVMAAAPWPTRAARRWPAWAALGIATAGAVAAVLALRTSPAPTALPAPPAAVVTPRPAESVAATVVATVAPPVPAPGRRETREDAADTKAPAATLAAAPSPLAPRPADPELRLQATSERDGQPIAIINDHLVRVGDEVDGIRVLAIRGAEVDVEVRGRRTTLRF
jgi:hypothetical protein